MHPILGLCLGFLFVYSSLIGYLRSACWRDPTSKFFQDSRAHDAPYSSQRIEEALEFADLVDAGRYPSIDNDTRLDPPELCVGVPSVKRDDIQYLKSTLGSLQEGLTEEERAALQFVVLLAHVDESEHPDYGQAWLEGMVDVFASYRDDDAWLAAAQAMAEGDPNHSRKSKFDYSIVLDTCARTGAPYTLMIEDDVVFLNGWRHRTMEALRSAEAKTKELGQDTFMYLRLFYFEGLLGWNAEAWPRYLASSLFAIAAVTATLLLARRLIPNAHFFLTRPVLVLVTLVFAPLFIGLFFAAGGNCTLPRPRGVHVMSKNACCGQGLVFPAATVADTVLPVFRANSTSPRPTDGFIEDLADETGLLRWALTPAVLQHVGGQSSHGVFRGKYGNMTPGRIWNYGFEENSVDDLAMEHQRISNGWDDF